MNRKQLLYGVLTVSLIVVAALVGFRLHSPTELNVERPLFRSPSNDCGPACLYVAAKLAGKSESLEAVIRRARNGDDGTSMLNLRIAAQELGFEVEALKVTTAWLERASLSEDSSFILYVRPHHYILVRRNEGTKPFGVFDPSFGVLQVDSSFLKKHYHWSGELLVLKGLAT